LKKIKTISRSEEQFTRERPIEISKVFHNLDPNLHPFERAREYTRALNAVKLEKVFAKPFVAALEGKAK
jgi:WD repeat and SOF domain-containing protein 1